MVETDEQEMPSTGPTENDEPKETEKLLNINEKKITMPSATESVNTVSQKADETNNQQQQQQQQQPQPPQQQQQESKKPAVNGEDIVNTPLVTNEGREVKPKKIPIGGIKMPGFFTRAKPNKGGGAGTESDAAYGELLENAGNEAKVDEQKIKQENEKNARSGFLSSLKFRNPFAKHQPGQQLHNEDDDELKEKKKNDDLDAPKTQNPVYDSADIGGGAGDAITDGTTADNINDNNQPKSGKYNKPIFSFKLPNFNVKSLKSKSNKNDDVEMGNGPNNKAGLASMETLDDSLKDTDGGGVNGNGKDPSAEKVIVTTPLKKSTGLSGGDVGDGSADDDLETVKLNDSTDDNQKAKELDKEKEAANGDENANNNRKSYRTINCSLDDLAIIAGITLVVVLVIIILAFTLNGELNVIQPPLRDGKYIVAVTSCGHVEGVLEDSSYVFRGVPYAAQPIGNRRWKFSNTVVNVDDCWNDTFKAYDYNETMQSTISCWQLSKNGSAYGTDECLTLDIVTPHIRYDNPLPVVVLIGADSLHGGSPNKLRPSARYARARDVIFVRPNFRIGMLGFLALDVLANETYSKASGNYGLSDIISALKWIQLNIEHFGGDRTSVTLFGHRAGATLVTAVASSPFANKLFTRLWISSGSGKFPGANSLQNYTKNSQVLTEVCANLSCLYDKSSEELTKQIPDTWIATEPNLPTERDNPHEWLTSDGSILSNHPIDVWKFGEIPQMVIGTTAHESHTDTLLNLQKEWTAENVRQYVEKSIIGKLNKTKEIFERYNDTYQGLVSMISDIRTICPLLTFARSLPNIPFYVVTQTGGDLNIADGDADVQAILGRYEPKTPEQRRYVSAMQQLFYHYVSHGEIKEFDNRDSIIEIGQDALKKPTYPNCDFWIKNDIVPKYARLD